MECTILVRLEANWTKCQTIPLRQDWCRPSLGTFVTPSSPPCGSVYHTPNSVLLFHVSGQTMFSHVVRGPYSRWQYAEMCFQIGNTKHKKKNTRCVLFGILERHCLSVPRPNGLLRGKCPKQASKSESSCQSNELGLISYITEVTVKLPFSLC